MTIRLGIVMDPIAAINTRKDSSFAMLLEAQKRGYEIHYMEMSNLFIQDNTAWASTRQVQLEDAPDNWYRFLSAAQNIELSELDVILMRKDPPFDMEYIYATYIPVSYTHLTLPTISIV